MVASPRHSSNTSDMIKNNNNPLFSLNSWIKFGRILRRYTGAGKGVGGDDITTPAALGAFIHSRASHVAQTSLYGYMKTRVGTRFPALFDTPAMLASINIAKWHMWLACLSDLAVYSGVLLCRRTDTPAPRIRAIIGQIVAAALAQTGTPAEAGDDFADAAGKLEARIAHAALDQLGDDDSAFTESPAALVYWSPIADELKNRDVEIIRNSVRFRWQEVRRDLRRRLQADVLVGDRRE